MTPRIIKFLETERDWTLETINLNWVGVTDGKLKAHLLERGYSVREMIDAGLLKADGTDYF